MEQVRLQRIEELSIRVVRHGARQQVRLQRIEELSIRVVRHGASAFAKDRGTLHS